MKVSLEPGQLTSQEWDTRSDEGNKQNSALSSSQPGKPGYPATAKLWL